MFWMIEQRKTELSRERFKKKKKKKVQSGHVKVDETDFMSNMPRKNVF